MKAAQLTPAATPAKKNSPFFNKESGQDFFDSANNEEPFFSKTKNNNYSIQTKLIVGAPNDIYEKEADSMADNVVQRLSDSSSIQTKSNSIGSVTPFVQKECAHCEEEEKLQKKEKENDKLLNGKFQKKPIFESNAEPPDDDSFSLGNAKSEIKRKCTECDKEEKLQKKELSCPPVNMLQKQSIGGPALATTPAAQSSALPASVVTQWQAHIKANQPAVAVNDIITEMIRRGEINPSFYRVQQTSTGAPPCQTPNPQLITVTSSVNGANTQQCPCVTIGSSKYANPRMEIHDDLVKFTTLGSTTPQTNATILHSTLLHEFRHVRQQYEECNTPGIVTSSGLCTDCNNPEEMDAYLAEIEAGYNQPAIMNAWVRVFVNWNYLSPVQQNVFNARKQAAEAKVNSLFPRVTWNTNQRVIIYQQWCQSIQGGAVGTCNSFMTPATQAGSSQPNSPAQPSQTNSTIQRKCAACEEEKKLQKKEKEDENLLNGKLQKKPIFESNTEPPGDDDSFSFGNVQSGIQRKCAECEKEEILQKKPDHSSYSTLSNIENSINSSRGSGSSLPTGTRTEMENSFGADFSNVRIHNDSSAVQMSKDLNAQAFTHGSDIYFNSGKYDTNSKSGKHLLAHELTHVVQQRPVDKIRKYPMDGAPAGDPKKDPNVKKALGGDGGTAAAAPAPVAALNPARLIEDKTQPSIGPTPLEKAYDVVIKLLNSKEIMPGTQYEKSWDFIDADATLFNFPTEVGVVISLGGGIHAGAKFGYKIDPITLRNVRVGLSNEQLKDITKYAAIGSALSTFTLGISSGWAIDKILSGHYWGDATLDFGAEITGSFDFSAELRAEASFAKLIKLAVIKAGLNAGAKAGVRASAKMPVQIEIKNKRISFDTSLFFESDFLLSLFLKANLEAELLGWKFNVAEIGFEKEFAAKPLAFTLGTPVKLNSENSDPKKVVDIPMIAEKVKKFVEVFKNHTSNILEPEKVDEGGEMGEIAPPKNVLRTRANGGSYDPYLSALLANERRNVGYKEFDDFKGTNVAVFKYKIYEGNLPDESKLVKDEYEAAPNKKGVLHSEAQIIGKLHEIHKSYGKGKTYLFKVTHVLSERIPCTSCSSYLRTPSPLVSTQQAQIYYLVPWITSPQRAYLENIRSLIMSYGMKPPTVEAILEKEQKAKEDKAKGAKKENP